MWKPQPGQPGQPLYVKVDDNDSDVVMHYKRRMKIHVIKLAMIFSASYSNDMTISREDMSNAIKCLGDVLANLDKAFRGVGESELAESSAKVQGFIERKGITSRSEILKNMHRHITSENLERVLALFANIGIISYFSQGGKELIKMNGVKAAPTATTTVDLNTINKIQ